MLAYMNDTSSPLKAYPASAAAKVDGAMKFFKAEYSGRRLAARKGGETFMPTVLEVIGKVVQAAGFLAPFRPGVFAIGTIITIIASLAFGRSTRADSTLTPIMSSRNFA
jgi:hypothetical protein